MVMEVVGSCYSPLGFNAGVISQAEERGFSTADLNTRTQNAGYKALLMKMRFRNV